MRFTPIIFVSKPPKPEFLFKLQNYILGQKLCTIIGMITLLFTSQRFDNKIDIIETVIGSNRGLS